jgi:transposase
MKRFVEGEDRQQATLLPACLDDYVTEGQSGRVIDVFIDELDLEALGFAVPKRYPSTPGPDPWTVYLDSSRYPLV